ncbi:MAG TPA: nitrate/sulfonate/bicarbonate ABC transporter ATP-binding protein [Caldilineaceae bacterium]|nr:nitrate/sulfonate/bicarbonate ABC transporter ATP-binding protein [Caldilineaceae bacterium]
MKAEQLLELRNVDQRYRSGQRTFTAVEDVNLTVRAGEFVALLGPSGCGKSTLLRIITGLQRPTSGEVRYRGQRLQGVNPHATIVFQTFALFPWLSVLGNVEIALKARGVPESLRTPRALDLLDRVGLDGFENAYPRELSGGMRQKVGFARAMAVEPELLCLDEPFSALDVLSAESLRSDLIELWTSGRIPTQAILMVTHNIEEAVLMAGRIVVMDKGPGRVVADLPVDLPYPRERKTTAFNHLVDLVYGILAGQTQPEHIEFGTAPGEPGLTRALPHIAIHDLIGLLEYLARLPAPHADIYRLAGELGLDSDHLLRLIEAAELLGFASVVQGDITLTPLGETFVDAGILGRKEIFAARLRRLPMFKWLFALLRAADRHQLPWEVVRTALELEFPRTEAERQLDSIVDWGRYAEALAYDDGAALLALEPNAEPAGVRPG